MFIFALINNVNHIYEWTKGLFKLMLNWIEYSSPESRKMTTGFFWDHPNGYADDNIRSTFMVDGYPYLMLVGPDKRVIIMQASLKKVKEILSGDKT